MAVKADPDEIVKHMPSACEDASTIRCAKALRVSQRNAMLLMRLLQGHGCIEKISFEAYNESTCLIEAIERFKERTGYYPERVLVDQIYRIRENRTYCTEHGIWLLGSKLGRPSAIAKVDKKQEYQDNTDRIEVERTFSLSKRCYGMSCIATKTGKTLLTSIALSVFVTNLFKIQR